ncbi:amino acid adenylation domain-containing protein [Streptomyces shenzhenensis]
MPVVPARSRTVPDGAGTHGRLNRFFEDACDRTPSACALECGSRRLTYAELDARANQVARRLRGAGIGRHSRVALLLPRSVEMYVCLLGVCKSGAAFVPVDPAAPPGRVSFILGDSGVTVVLTTCALARGAAWAEPDGPCPVIRVDACAEEFARLSAARIPERSAGADDPLAYVMYTSGSSGRPKGVEIARSSICNFLRVVSPVYGIRPHDRVYQGMAISFDFSIEEIWPTWTAGATLVAGPGGPARLGADLADFLQEHDVTALYCVPTLLATIPRDLPRIRSLIVGGEACPASLVERWSRPGRRMLNTYGPTEATVTATWQELRPDRPVTIGRPLPTYSAVLLDERLRPVPHGAVGEICLGGPGLARGYAGRPDLTADRFVEHPPTPGPGRLYRTGDLGRMTGDGEIEYLGRADAEVKIRGYRVSLDEIDNVLLEDPGVGQAATAFVAPRDGWDGDRVLAAYVVPAGDGTALGDDLAARLHERLRRALPAYMVPSTLDLLDRLPVMPSGKVDRGALPAPSGRRLIGTREVVPVGDAWEAMVRDAWAQALSLAPEELSAEADFFTDLGGHSLLAARAVSLVREQTGAAGSTLRDLYENPTVRAFAARLRSARGAPPPPPRPRLRTRPVDLDEVVYTEVREARRHTPLLIDQHSVGAARVQGDADALARVVRNLLDNALRHAETRIDVTLRTEHGTAQLVVADDGPGIPEADRERVFGRFTRLDDARARDTGGTGLGLAIVRDIVTAHHGTARIEDNRPGARLVVSLPIEHQPPSPAAPAPRRTPLGGVPGVGIDPARREPRP